MLLCLLAAVAASQPKGRQRLHPLGAEDKAAFSALANQNADAAAMLKAAEKANAAWRHRAEKILQRVEAAQADEHELTPSSGKRQRFAKATQLVDADDAGRSPAARLREKGLPSKSVELRAPGGGELVDTPRVPNVQEEQEVATSVGTGVEPTSTATPGQSNAPVAVQTTRAETTETAAPRGADVSATLPASQNLPMQQITPVAVSPAAASSSSERLRPGVSLRSPPNPLDPGADQRL